VVARVRMGLGREGRKEEEKGKERVLGRMRREWKDSEKAANATGR
jgi:hypothetical protein